MSVKVMNLVGRLDLQPKEINYLKLSDERKLLIHETKEYISSPIKQNLLRKLRLEARHRMWKHKLELLPSNEDIELFSSSLRNNAIYSKSEDGKLIDYYKYKQSIDLAPKTLRDFLSTQTFMDLLQISNNKDEGYITVDSIVDYLDLQDFLREEVLPHIPSLANLNEEEPMLQDYYLCMATRKFFFTRPNAAKKVRIIDIVASRLLEEFETLNESSNDGIGDDDEPAEIEQGTSQTIDTLNWFSKRNCLRIKDLYEQLDTDGNGLLSFSEMTDFQRVTNSFMQRVFEVQQTYDNDELDLRGFCDLLLAMENKSDRSALSYYFRVLDVDGDNLLTASDMNFFYRDLARLLEDCFSDDSLQKAPLFEDVKNEIFDMCCSKNPEGITLKELISSGKGGTVVGMLTDLDAFLEYENREDVIYQE
ncbi:Serine/threonine-protein phosphatase 2A regulatory subunit B'' subunit gamma [Dirofilaria immitis]|nr:Serine/threonine-protein phosphatase 2A regulatory subunit B'' subunit gamma [Dirofilaria immitis]